MQNGGKRKKESKGDDDEPAAKRASVLTAKQDKAAAPESASDRCEEACYHAAFCGRGAPKSKKLVPNASDLNFEGVLKHLKSSPPIDHRLIPDQLVPGKNCAWKFGNYSCQVFVAGQQAHHGAGKDFRISLLGAAVATEWDHFVTPECVAKRAILELVLLAGATIDGGIRGFAGAALSEAGGPVSYDNKYPLAVLDMCTAAPAARCARWPDVLAEITAAEPGAAYAVVRRHFLEVCCEGKVDAAAIEALVNRPRAAAPAIAQGTAA